MSDLILMGSPPPLPPSSTSLFDSFSLSLPLLSYEPCLFWSLLNCFWLKLCTFSGYVGLICGKQISLLQIFTGLFSAYTQCFDDFFVHTHCILMTCCLHSVLMTCCLYSVLMTCLKCCLHSVLMTCCLHSVLR